MKKIFISILFVVLALSTYAQNSVNTEKHPQETNNIGLGFGGVHLINENDWATGIHLHYGKSLGEKKRFSIGAGAELLMGEHRHASVAIGLCYSLTQALSFGYSSGLEFHLDNSEENSAILAHHIEISYEFDLEFIHLGPMLEYGFNNEDQHLMFGIHAGFSF